MGLELRTLFKSLMKPSALKNEVGYAANRNHCFSFCFTQQIMIYRGRERTIHNTPRPPPSLLEMYSSTNNELYSLKNNVSKRLGGIQMKKYEGLNII